MTDTATALPAVPSCPSCGGTEWQHRTIMSYDRVRTVRAGGPGEWVYNDHYAEDYYQCLGCGEHAEDDDFEDLAAIDPDSSGAGSVG